MPESSKSTTMREELRSSAGFTMIELAITILVLGVILGIGALSYANVRQSMNLQSARKQVEAAITRAKLSARQENVEYHITFYPDGGEHANTYEFERYMYDEASDTWSLEPTDKSIGDERTTASMDGHVFVEIGSDARIINSDAVTVMFKPAGTEQEVTSISSGGGQNTITLQAGSKTGSVHVDAQGRITMD